VSRPGEQNNTADFTHPVIAALDHPLFACGGKRGIKLFVLAGSLKENPAPACKV